jgi:hypothetical protein
MAENQKTPYREQAGVDKRRYEFEKVSTLTMDSTRKDCPR